MLPHAINNKKTTTIAAIATPPGYGGIGILRLSGPLSYQIACKISQKQKITPRCASHTPFYDSKQEILDDGIVLYFPAPHSFTGEDVIEFQGHGSPVALNYLLETCLQNGAILAEPGEFSKRAFLNDKIDLVQAEAIADLIYSASRNAAKAAVRSLTGVFSVQIKTIVEQFYGLRMYVEAAIDFPDEELDLLSQEKITTNLCTLKKNLDALLTKTQQGILFQEGIHITIVGKPNAGKSSLLNQLTEKESAIVTDIPGTTRDVLKEQILLNGIPLHLHDTAGLRESNDPIEIEGMRRTYSQVALADLILLLIDATSLQTRNMTEIIAITQKEHAFPEKKQLIVVINKIDKTLETATTMHVTDPHSMVLISAKTGDGIDLLKNMILTKVGYHDIQSDLFSANTRHKIALTTALETLEKTTNYFIKTKAIELLAEDLRCIQNVLENIIGSVSSDTLLGMIFSQFCIGK